jgi:type IV pilus assembly protein PilC
MKRFKYKAKNSKGELITGEVEAVDTQLAVKLVKKQGLFLITLTPISDININFIKSFQQRVTSNDLVNTTRQLATMVNAGLPLTEALVILRSQSRGGMQKVTASILADVEEGESLSKSMSKYPSVFSKTYIALVKSGEVGGVLDEVLVRLADDLEKQQEFTGKVKSALIYPAVIVVGMVGVALIMVIFVIPRLATLYTQFNADLPITTKLLIWMSDAVINFWPIMIVGIGALVYGIKIYKKTEAGQKRIDEWTFRIPIVGELYRQIILTDLTRTLSLMIGSGVSIIEALSIAAEVVRSRIISEALKDTTKMVEKGFPIAFSFSRHPEAFPFILSQMVAVGEETGKMDEVLAKISHVMEVESDQKLKGLTAAIEPIILIVLGLGVAFLVISIIMPIYNLTTKI